MLTIFSASCAAKRGDFDRKTLALKSTEILGHLENAGVQVEATGLEHVYNMKQPCVFISNHMSMLETLVLPAFLCPTTEITFIVKKTLYGYPVFKHIMSAMHNVAVTRTHSRADLKAVLAQGGQRLQAGISIVVFPQTTRTTQFDPALFNSMGIKLAHNNQVPVVPVALRTDAWANGGIFKDLGKLDPNRRVHFAFGEPLVIEGRGERQHQAVIKFIQTKLQEWEHDV